MKQQVRWSIGWVIVLWTSHASAQAMTGLFTEIVPFITDFVNMLYMVGVAGIVIGAIWAAYKWYNTREMSEGWQGMLTVCISAIWLFFIVPKLVASVPTFTRGG